MVSPGEPAFVDAGDPVRIADTLGRLFEERTGRDACVLTAAPGRVNLIGEHVDYNGGRCLPLALPHATYAALAPRDDRVLRMSSRQTDDTVELSLDDLRPGAVEGWAAYVAGVVWALGEDHAVPGLDIVVDGHVPLGGGLSSSAALECAVALGIAELLGQPDSPGGRRALARACVRAESEMAGAPTGGMDQAVALHARPAHAVLLDFAEHTETQVPWDPDAHGLTLLVIDTRVAHQLTDGGYAARRRDCESAAHALGVQTLREVQGRPELLASLTEERVCRRTRHVLAEMDRVDAAVAALEEADVSAIGPLLDASHDSLRDDFEVSCPELDLVVETCREDGALGARLTGGGFGGSAIALLPVERVQATAEHLVKVFARRSWPEPRFLTAPASAAARRIR